MGSIVSHFLFLMLGSILGIIHMCVMQVASAADEEMERQRIEKKKKNEDGSTS
ncbi:DUF3789 domain-containing protein [Enterococcus casseliflavus]|uniref:DUF3789 domain-containing protein n=1 Tax=Enterococcus casseliflavus TaxID=37734 RepID=UPI0034D20DDD